MSMTSEGLRPARRRKTRKPETLSVAEMCDEIREAPAYDAAAGVSMRTLATAYEEMRCVAVELVGWIEGDDDSESEVKISEAVGALAKWDAVQKAALKKGGRES
jgi:hypothetical protein